MANAIPLLEGTDASGGYLVSDTYGQTLQDTILRESAVMSLARVDRVPGKRQRYAVYAGRPTAAFVAEGAAKAATGAEFSEVVVNVKKIASIVMYTEELIEDAREDPTVLVSADVEAAFSDLIDAHAIGFANGSSVTTQFDDALKTTSQSQTIGGKGDGIAVAISGAIGDVEAKGGTPNGIILQSGAKAQLRDARKSSSGAGETDPVYTDGFNREPDTLYGLPIRYSSNLEAFPGAAAAKTVGIVGDFNHAVFALRKDITVKSSDQATVDVAGTAHHLWQQNKTAMLWEMRVGFNLHDKSRMFSLVKTAAA